MTDFSAARQNMILRQLEPNRVTDTGLTGAMAAVPRELFVPEAFAGVAYVDEDIEIAPGRYLMEPMVFARMLQAAAIEPGAVVLDIGCGSGYSTAVLSRLAGTVVALESDPDLAGKATRLLSELGADNAAVVTGDLAAGMAGQGPYDVIVLNGSVPSVPNGLCDQLADGGRLVAVINEGGAGTATLVSRRDGLLSSQTLFDASTPPLPGFEAEAGFEF